MTYVAVVSAFVLGFVLGAVAVHAAVHQRMRERSARIEVLAGDLLREVERLRSTVERWQRGISARQALH